VFDLLSDNGVLFVTKTRTTSNYISLKFKIYEDKSLKVQANLNEKGYLEQKVFKYFLYAMIFL
jgi:hypothetical protein